MMTAILEALKQIPIFFDLPEEVLADLSEKIVEHKIEKGDVLFRQGSIGDSLFIITKGRVRIFIENGMEGDLTLILFGPGEFIGEMAILEEKPRSASVAALDSVEVLELKREDFLDVLRAQPVLAIGMMHSLAARLRFTSTYLTKSMDWTRQIAAGDYNSAIEQIQSAKSGVTDIGLSDEDKANKFISSFFQMVEGVKKREETLKDTVQMLRIEIDEVKRDRQVSEITETEYFKRLKDKAGKLKKQRIKK